MKGRIAVALVLTTVAALASVAFASVFVYYPFEVSIAPARPPIEILPGDNAGDPDLSGNTIEVAIGANRTSLTVTLHPTYQTTYYHDIAQIDDVDTSNTYYVWIRVKTPVTGLPSGSEAYLVVYDPVTDDYYLLDLTSSGASVGPFTTDDVNNIRLDFKFIIPEGTKLPTTAVSASLEIAYSNQGASSPPTPP